MRTIETKMLSAVYNRADWQLDNTSVRYSQANKISRIYLFGNHICDYQHQDKVIIGTPLPCEYMFKLYPTRTTVSRLRALGINARVKQGIATIDGVAV